MARCPCLVISVLIVLFGGIKWKCVKHAEGFCTKILSLNFLFIYPFFFVSLSLCMGITHGSPGLTLHAPFSFTLPDFWYFHFTKYQFWFWARRPSVFLFKCSSLPRSRPAPLLRALQFGLPRVLCLTFFKRSHADIWLRSVPSLVCSFPDVLR